MKTKVVAGPRHREEGNQYPLYVNYVVTTTGPLAGYPYSGVAPTGGYGGSFTIMDDVVTPGFKKKVRAGVVINNPMGKYTLETGIPQLDCTSASTGQAINAIRRYFGDVTGYVFGPLVPVVHSLNQGMYPDPPGVDVATCQRVISTQAWKNVNPPSALSLVTLAEAQKSFNLIHGNAVKLANVIQLWKAKRPWSSVQAYLGKDIRLAKRPEFMPVWHPSTETLRTKHGKTRGVWVHEPLSRKRWSALDESTRRWLEWRYGWNPLVKDIVDHMKAVLRPEPWRERTRHTSRGYFDKDGTVRQLFANRVNLQANYTYSVETFTRVKGRAYVIWELNPGNPFGRLNDFGLFDLPRTALELVPYSFVAAWAINYDDFLQAWQPKIGATIIASGSTIHVRKRVDRVMENWTPVTQPNGSIWLNPAIPIGSSDWLVMENKSRRVPLDLPDRPIVDVQLNVKRLVDAFALLRGAVSRSTTRL